MLLLLTAFLESRSVFYSSQAKLINFFDCNKFHTIAQLWYLLEIVLGISQHSRFPAPRQEGGGGNGTLSLMVLALRELLSMLGATGRKPL